MYLKLLLACFFGLVAVMAMPGGDNADADDMFRRATTTTPKTYCTPWSNTNCWPKDSDWAILNKAVNGNLIKVTPWAAPCFSNSTYGPFDPVACATIRATYTDGDTRANQVGTAEEDNWAYCYADVGPSGDCSLNAATINGVVQSGVLLPEPPTRMCGLGRISPYAVNVKSEKDVQAAIAFARYFNIKIAIKNTGHEYQGRDTAPDSLMIWTHNLRAISTGTFNGVPSITLGAGVLAEEAYRAASLVGQEFIGGAYSSVGVAGGFINGGGHGPLQPSYGLAVDNALQFKVVTANAQFVTANANTNTDLFWALRGGGGGTFGVVTEVTTRTYPSKNITAIVYNMTINPLYTQAQKLAAISDFVQNQALYEPGWRKKGWSGYTFITTSYILFSHFLIANIATASADMTQFAAYLQAKQLSGQWVVQAQPPAQFPNIDSCRELIFKLGEPETPVAYSERLAGRLIRYDTYATAQSRKQLGDAVAAAFGAANSNDGVPANDIQYRAGESIQLYSTGPPLARFGGPTGADTGVNTAWRDSIWEVLLFVNWVQGISTAGRDAIAAKTDAAMDYVRPFGDGCYFSESSPLEKNWQTAFFGNNYNRLVQIKKQLDPNNVFLVYKGIGYEGNENSQQFRCYAHA